MIANNKTRIPVTIPIDLKEQIESLAKKDGRSTSNLIVKLIKDYVEKKNRN